MKCKKEIKGYGGTRAGLVSGRPRKIPLRQRWQSCSRHKRWEERWNGKVGRALQVEGPEKASDAEDVWGCGTKKTKQWAHLGLSNTLLEKHSRALIRTNCDYEGQHPSAFRRDTGCWKILQWGLFVPVNILMVSHNDRLITPFKEPSWTKYQMTTMWLSCQIGKIALLIPNNFINYK